MDLSKQRCSNHQHREAAAQCPDCERFFCRECVTEHDGRMLCATCLSRRSSSENSAGSRFTWLYRSLLLLTGFVLLWSIFYYLGRLLILLPTSFHDGTLWQTGWWN